MASFYSRLVLQERANTPFRVLTILNQLNCQIDDRCPVKLMIRMYQIALYHNNFLNNKVRIRYHVT